MIDESKDKRNKSQRKRDKDTHDINSWENEMSQLRIALEKKENVNLISLS